MKVENLHNLGVSFWGDVHTDGIGCVIRWNSCHRASITEMGNLERYPALVVTLTAVAC